MTVVLLHAVGLDAGTWEGVDVRDAAALDLPGFGQEPALNDLHLTKMADDVVRRAPRELLDVVGVSMGAQVAVQIGLRHPSRVRSLLLANSGPRADPAVMRERARQVHDDFDGAIRVTLDRWFSEDALSAAAPFVERARQCLLRTGPTRLAAGWMAIAEHNVTDHLVDLRMPVTVLAASGDRASPAAALSKMQGLIPGSRLAIIDGPHIAYMECPDRFSHAIADHLRWVARQR